ncbi:MAG: radical SAM protein [Candidatus Desulfofervidus auxilii]|nr:radical SAM protein [Candidatus Desulfofervidus auxilii]
MKYIFGPVPSRRLGFSLGLDLVPFKTCSYDCIYCELGRTTHLSIEPAYYVTAKEILKELEDFFAENHPHIDFITIGGSGEPTLNKHLEEIILSVKALSKVPVAVLTNGSLFWQKDIIKAVSLADVVLPSLDTVSYDTWKRLNRPHPMLKLDKIIEGLKDFRQQYDGKIWLEILFVKGINDNESEIFALKSVLNEILPDKIHLNTVVRPPAEANVLALNFEEMKKIKEMIGEKAEIIVDFKGEIIDTGTKDIEERLIAILKRRPCTLNDIIYALGVRKTTVIKLLELYQRKKRIDSYLYQGQKYYLIR